VAPGLFPLLGSSLELGFADLTPLDPRLQDAQVVGIGESVHTTAGQHHLRLRLLRYLIERHGFRAIALEGNWGPIHDVMEPYVQTCTGSAEDAAKALHSIWWDVTLPPFLTWLCTWNQAHPDARVHVYGFDIRQPWSDLPAIRAFLTEHAPDVATSLSDGMMTCLGADFPNEMAFFQDATVRSYYGRSPMPEPAHTACQGGATALLAYLGEHQSALVTASSADEVEVLRLRVVGMAAFDQTIFHLSHAQDTAAVGTRDPAMFEIYRTLQRLRFAGLKTVLWAHNDHVLRHADEVTGSVWEGVQSLGTSISDDVGSAYTVVGQISYQTRLNWFDGPTALPTPASTSLEKWLADLAPDAMAVDLHVAMDGDPPVINPATYDVGFLTLTPSHHFDVILWQRVSTAVTYFADPGF